MTKVSHRAENQTRSHPPFTLYVLRFTLYALRFIGQRVDPGLIVAALPALLIVQPFLQPGLPTTADLAIHLYRAMEYEQAWAAGVVVPRWAPNLAFGYGYPLFVFAPPLPYLLTLLFHWSGLSFESAFKLLIILTILLYAIGAYLLERDLLGSRAAGLVAAVAYAFAPFALREALLYGGNIPQFLAIGLFPWALWGMIRAAFNRSWGWAILAALFYAGVVLSHLFQALIFTPIVAIFGLILALPSYQTSTCRSLNRLPLLTIPLGLLLSAFFWLPAFFERYATRAQADIYLEKSPFFVRYPYWPELLAWIEPLDARAANPYVPLTLGVVTLLLAGLGVLFGAWFVVRKQHLEDTSRPAGPPTWTVIVFFSLVAAASIFMTLPLSRPLWETVSILQVAEFPWRTLGLANLGLAVVAGAAILWFPVKSRPWLTAGIVLIQLWAIAPLLYPVIGFTRYGDPSPADQIRYERSSQSIGTTTLGEYLPRTVTRPPTTSPLVEAFEAGRYPERLDRTSLPPQATARLLRQNATTHRYQLHTPAGFTLRLYQFAYPGWRAWLDDRPVEIQPEPETGLILIDIPAGQHTLTVRFGETPLRVMALGVSGVTAVWIIVILWRRRRRGVALPGGFAQGRGSGGAGEQSFQEASRGSGGAGEQPFQEASRGSGGEKIFKDRPLAAQLKVLGYAVILSLAIIVSFWLKPLLRPLFTIQSPPGVALPAQQPVDIRFSQGIRLIGYSIAAQTVRPGDYLPVVLYWETGTAPLRLNLQPFVHLDRLNDWTTMVGATNYTPGDVTTESNMPTFHWDTQRYVRDEHDLIIPPNIPPVAYAVQVGLINPDEKGQLLPLADGSGDTAQLTIINVRPAAAPKPLQHPLNITFQNETDTIRLVGFQQEALTPARLEFTLAWRSDRPAQKNYTVFAQLLDLNHNLVASFDRPPLDGAYPTSTWLPDQTIIDPRYIPLNEVTPGAYRLVVGLYDSTTQQRLTTAEGIDFVELAMVNLGDP